MTLMSLKIFLGRVPAAVQLRTLLIPCRICHQSDAQCKIGLTRKTKSTKKNKGKGTSSSHDSDNKDTDGMEYIGNIEYPTLGYDASMQIEDQQQGVDQSVGNSSHLPESTESLEPNGQPVARPSSPKDMTTGEPVGANNAEIDMTSFFGSTDEENRVSERILKGKGKVVAVSSELVGITNVRKDDLDETRTRKVEGDSRILSYECAYPEYPSLEEERFQPSPSISSRAVSRHLNTTGNLPKRHRGSPVPPPPIRRNSSGI